MKKVLVTGGMGFIGRYVVEELQHKNYIPVIFDHQRRLQHEYPLNVEVFLGDVRDDVAIVEAMAHVDGWIHLAAVLGTQETIKNPRPAALSNLMGGLNVLEAATQYNLPGVYIAVGNWWMNNTYSITKNMIERFVSMYNKDRGTKINILRVVNAYGPRQLVAAPYGPGKVRKITPSFVCRALCNHPIELYGGGTQTSDMVYVEDVAKALVLSLEMANNGNVLDYAVEIGPKEHLTVKEVAELIRELANSNSEIISIPMRPGELPDSKVIADISTLAGIGFNIADLTPINNGMLRTIAYFNSHKGSDWNEPRK